MLSWFTSVSLLTGSTEVWIGVGFAIAATIAAIAIRTVRLWLQVTAAVLALACIASGVYTEIQLQHRSDQISNDLNRVGAANVQLSHRSVESYIQSQLGATNVVCNDGSDFEMAANGDAFTCTADGHRQFSVTIKDKETGAYEVR